MRVTRGSRVSLNSGPCRSFSARRSIIITSASGTIVRNLYMVNGTPSRPTRCWRKRMGRPSNTRMANAVRAMTGRATPSVATATTTSTARFTNASRFEGPVAPRQYTGI